MRVVVSLARGRAPSISVGRPGRRGSGRDPHVGCLMDPRFRVNSRQGKRHGLACSVGHLASMSCSLLFFSCLTHNLSFHFRAVRSFSSGVCCVGNRNGPCCCRSTGAGGDARGLVTMIAVAAPKMKNNRSPRVILFIVDSPRVWGIWHVPV